jgi:uncharacterized protein (DUF1330 family)
MTAFVIAELEITDAELFKGYGPLVPATLEQYGGKFAVRRATVTALEGGAPTRVAILAFEDSAAAKRWHDSPEYAVAKAIRQKSTKSRMFIVEG